RWGLYHDRADLPVRDDGEWLFHLNLRRRADGAMEFVKRPVEPYLVPVPEFSVPAGAEPVLLGAHATTTVRRAAATALKELVEVLPPTRELGAALAERATGADA